MKKPILYGLMIFSIMGIIYSSILFHEGIHMLRMEKPMDVCMSIGGGDYEMYVSGEDTDWNSKKEEVFAYTGQFTFVIVFSYFAFLYFRGERLKK